MKFAGKFSCDLFVIIANFLESQAFGCSPSLLHLCWLKLVVKCQIVWQQSKKSRRKKEFKAIEKKKNVLKLVMLLHWDHSVQCKKREKENESDKNSNIRENFEEI